MTAHCPPPSLGLACIVLDTRLTRTARNILDIGITDSSCTLRRPHLHGVGRRPQPRADQHLLLMAASLTFDVMLQSPFCCSDSLPFYACAHWSIAHHARLSSVTGTSLQYRPSDSRTPPPVPALPVYSYSCPANGRISAYSFAADNAAPPMMGSRWAASDAGEPILP